jgi:hypothetical protein
VTENVTLNPTRPKIGTGAWETGWDFRDRGIRKMVAQVLGGKRAPAVGSGGDAAAEVGDAQFGSRRGEVGQAET